MNGWLLVLGLLAVSLAMIAGATHGLMHLLADVEWPS